MYSEAEAARLLEVPQQTLHYWLEGKRYRGREYAPVIREKPTRRRTVTWAEFVEAGLLSQYRQQNIPLDELRQFIAYLRNKVGVPYPLASERPWAISGKLVIEAQDASGLPAEFWLVAPVGNQPLLLPPAQEFLDHVQFEQEIVARWHPVPGSPVVIDPDARSGRPSVGGISTSVINDYADDGYSYNEIAAEFGLDVHQVQMAVSYELSRPAA